MGNSIDCHALRKKEVTITLNGAQLAEIVNALDMITKLPPMISPLCEKCTAEAKDLADLIEQSVITLEAQTKKEKVN